MSNKKEKRHKGGLNYEHLIHYLKYETYHPDVRSENEKRNIRKRANSFRLEQQQEEEKLYFLFTDDESVKHEKEVVYKDEDQLRVFNEFHVNSKGSHLGREKLLNLIPQKYYWQGICQSIKDLIQTCNVCTKRAETYQSKKRFMRMVDQSVEEIECIITKNEEETISVPMETDLSGVSFSDSWVSSDKQFEPVHFWDIVEMKLLGPYSCNGRMKHVLVFMDVLSQWPEAAIVETMSQTVVTHVLLNLICRFGVMNKLILPDLQEDSSLVMPPRTDILISADINIEIINGQVSQTVEIWNEICQTMNQFVCNNPDWINCVNFALLPHRISRGRFTEYSPAFLTYGRELKLPQKLSNQPDQEILQVSDGYIPLEMKIQSIQSLMSVYKGYRGSVNISQDSPAFKLPNKPTPVRLVLNQGTGNRDPVSSSRTGSIISDAASSHTVSDDEDLVGSEVICIKQEDDEDMLPKIDGRKKRWSKTHRTSMDTSNSDYISNDQLQSYKALLETQENIQIEQLLESSDNDSYYERVVLYLTEKKYAPGVTTEHQKRNIRKAAESHFIEDGILYHKWRTGRRAVPLKFDDRFCILEACHIDDKGRHYSSRQMPDRLTKFYWKSMVVDTEAFVRTCITCNQSKSLSHENVTENFYDDTDEKRAKLAEENYSLLVKYLQKGKLIQSVPDNKSELITLLSKWYSLKNGQLYYRRPDRHFDVCLEISTRAQKNAIRDAHFNTDSDIHRSLTDTLDVLVEKFIWNGMRESCEDFVNSCCKLPKTAQYQRKVAFRKYNLSLRMAVFGKLRHTEEDSKISSDIEKRKDEILKKYQVVFESPETRHDTLTAMVTGPLDNLDVHTNVLPEVVSQECQTQFSEAESLDENSGQQSHDLVIDNVIGQMAGSHDNQADDNSTEEMEEESLRPSSHTITEEHQYTTPTRTGQEGQDLTLSETERGSVRPGIETVQTTGDGKSEEVIMSAVSSILPRTEGQEHDSDLEEVHFSEESDDDPSYKPENVKAVPVKPKTIGKKYDNKTKYRCKTCGKCIKGAIRFRSHVYEHTGVKPFGCDHCKKRFTTLKTKKLHMLSHTNNDTYLCSLCGKGFSNSTSLKSHVNIHEKGGNMTVKCEYCDRVFRTRNRYEKHKHFKHPHTPLVFRCEDCDKNFTTQRSLLRHNKAQHQKLKSHMCDVCGKGFYRKEYLRSHMATHNPGSKIQKPNRTTYTIEVMMNPPDESSTKYEVQHEYQIPNTAHYTTVGDNVTVSSEYAIPISEGTHITLPVGTSGNRILESTHVALPSRTVENQMTVEPTYYIDEESQVAHMLVYEQPAVQYEVECGGDSEETMDAAEALTAINMLAQASINQGY